MPVFNTQDPIVHNRCPSCSKRKPKDARLCQECLALCLTVGRLVAVRADAPRYAGRIGWVAGVRDNEVQVRTNHNGTLWFRIQSCWLDPRTAGS